MKSYVYAGTYVIIMGLLFKLFAVSASVSGKVDNYADNVDRCISLALKGIDISDCIENQDYSEDIVALNEVVNETIELNKKLHQQIKSDYDLDQLNFNFANDSINISIIDEI